MKRELIWSVVFCRGSVVSGRWSVVGGQWSVVSGRWLDLVLGAWNLGIVPSAGRFVNWLVGDPAFGRQVG